MEEYIAPRRKRIPYGMMNFAVIRRDDCYYPVYSHDRRGRQVFLLHPPAPFRQKPHNKYVAALL